MAKYIKKLNKFRCIGCHACEVHCKTKNDLPVGVRHCHIIADNSKVVGDTPKTEFSFVSCFHCDDPECVEACATGAMQKREDGIVFVDESECVGCQACIEACPWDVPQWRPETETVSKCDYCRDRVDQGLEPACVAKCTAHALEWATLE